MEANPDKRTPDQHALAYAENIIATLREPFVVLDKSLRVFTANAAFYRDFHVSKEETQGRFVFHLGNGQWDIPQLRTLLPQVLSNSHHVEDFEIEHAFPALGQRNMLLNARRFPSESDDPELVLLAIEDITDRRRAEAALKASEVRYRRLFQTAKDGILILDADTGKVIDANPFMTTLLGYSHDEFLGKELWEIGLFRDIKESQATYRELQENGYVRFENLPLESRSGQKVEVEFVSNAYLEDQHQVVQCNIRDITERSRLRRLTQEQAAALADLERRRQKAELEAVGRLAGGVAHVLNNLMTAVLGYSQIMLDDMKPGDTFFESAQAIKKSATRTATLTQKLLAFGRKQFLTLRPVDLNALVGGMAKVVQYMQGVQLGLSLEPGLRPTRTDPDRLEEAILTLVRNACEAMPDGGQVTIQTANVELGQDYTDDRPEVRPGPYVLLAVSDTGVGMGQEEISHMFEPFYTKEADVGAGLGLAAVYGLVKQCGGDIEVRSQPEKGTTFRLYLPRDEEE